MKEERIFQFTRKTGYNIVKRTFPDLSPNYFRMNRILQQGGYHGASEQFGLSANKRTREVKDWIQIKKNCISAFGNICPITGKSKPLHVHHIDFNTLNNEPRNLIPLWTKYHRLIHARADFSEEYKEVDRVFLSIITDGVYNE